MSDDALLGYGVPAEWLVDVREADEDGLLALAGHLLCPSCSLTGRPLRTIIRAGLAGPSALWRGAIGWGIA